MEKEHTNTRERERESLQMMKRERTQENKRESLSHIYVSRNWKKRALPSNVYTHTHFIFEQSMYIDVCVHVIGSVYGIVI